MKKLIILFLTILIISACQSGDKEQIVKIDNKYSISIPSFLVKSNITLNEEASLQYLHTWKEFYLIVIDEPKKDLLKALIENNLIDEYSNDLNGYTSLILDGFEQSVTISQKSEIIDTSINNLPARLITIKGRAEGINVFYSISILQGKERYYQIMAWTLQSKEYEYKDMMNNIMYSFKEL